MPGNRQILTVAQMVAAEQALIDGGETVTSLMERAGKGAADWVWRIAYGRPVTVLCGPGNNGGDGYVIARELSRRGLQVSVIAPLPPATEAAIRASQSCDGPIAGTGRGGVLVDCLFGSGLTRPLSVELLALLAREAARHDFRVAIDLPSGIESDSATPLNPGLPAYDLTLALGAWKHAHWMMPAMSVMGHRRLVPIGVGAIPGATELLAKPDLRAPAPDAYKYTRGLVVAVGGTMPGAISLAMQAALRAGAGGVRLAASVNLPAFSPDIVVKEGLLDETLSDARIGALLAGPGLGLESSATARLEQVLKANLPTVLDADALNLLRPGHLAGRTAPLVLTPHEGELGRLCHAFAIPDGAKRDRGRWLADATGAVVVAKGPDTIVFEPRSRTVIAPPASTWLSVAGSGDVLSGIVASRLSGGIDPFQAACEGVWLHGMAARIAGAAFTASGLAKAVSKAYAAAL